MDIIDPENDVINYDSQSLKRKCEEELPNKKLKKIKTNIVGKMSSAMDLEGNEPVNYKKSNEPKHNEASNELENIDDESSDREQNKAINSDQKEFITEENVQEDLVRERDEIIVDNELKDEQKENESSQSENLSFPNQENVQRLKNPLRDWKEFEVSNNDIKQQKNSPKLFDVNQIDIATQMIFVKNWPVFEWVIGNETHVQTVKELKNPFYLCQGFFSF